jgi:hypothetical protein
MKKIIFIALFVVLAMGLVADYTVIAEIEDGETAVVNLTPGKYFIEVTGTVLITGEDFIWWLYGSLSPGFYNATGYLDGVVGLPVTRSFKTIGFETTSTVTKTFSASANAWYNCTLISSSAKLVRTINYNQQ